MTTEKKAVFELSDITSIKLICTTCKHSQVYELENGKYSLPDRCPWCKAFWDDDKDLWGKINSLMSLVKYLHDRERPGAMIAKFEILADDIVSRHQ